MTARPELETLATNARSKEYSRCTSTSFGTASMKTLVFAFIAAIAVDALHAQENESGGSSLNLTIGNSGIAFGHADRVNGIRINWKDRSFDYVNGMNLTFWIPDGKPYYGTVNGLAIGLTAPAGERLHGVAITPGAVLAEEHMIGLNAGLLALVSQGDIYGLNIGGLASVAEGSIRGASISALAIVSQGPTDGLSLAGLATVSQGGLGGISFSGLAAVSQGPMWGLNVAGLATVSQGDLTGFSFAGLAAVTQGSVTGVTVGGLATVAQGDVSGVSLGGLAVVSQGGQYGVNLGGIALVAEDAIHGINVTIGQLQSEQELAGLNVGLYKMESPSITGVNVGLIWTESEELRWFSVSGYNRTYDIQKGLTIGLLNYAGDLLGIQIGLFNIVKANPPLFRYLPFINARF